MIKKKKKWVGMVFLFWYGVLCAPYDAVFADQASDFSALDPNDPNLSTLLGQLLSTEGIPNLNINPDQLLEAIDAGTLASLVPENVTLDLSSKIDSSLSDSFIQTFGFSFDQRHLSGTRPLGTNPGWIFGVNVTAASAMPSFQQSVNGLSGGAQITPSGITLKAGTVDTAFPPLPSVRFFIGKGLSDRLDVGVNFLPNYVSKIASLSFLQTISLLGFELKYLLLNNEEGLNVGMRLGYNINAIRFLVNDVQFVMNSRTFTPSLIFGKPFQYAEPYIGFSGQFVSGNLEIDTILYSYIHATIRKTSTRFGLNAFGGLQLRIPGLNIIIVPEGSYSLLKMYAFSLRVAFLL